ncbi:MAG: MBL fold metallo-hydrolase [Nocardioidaceae bacterium]|nr:MBL fold metallo-hydrolase [Nocardioidaceae bacterium]
MTGTPTALAVSPDSGTHWTEPGTWPVAAGVHRIPLPLPMDGLRAVNVYALETEAGLTLVDGGWAIRESRTALEAGLSQIGHTPADITRILVTHVHRDHYTLAVVLRREFGAHVTLGLADKATIDVLHERSAGGGISQSVRVLEESGAHHLATAWAEFSASSTPDLSQWDYPDSWLDGDQTIAVGSRSLDAVHTPGHTRGHFVFADREAGLMFAGDHVLPTITPSIGFEAAVADQPLGDFLGSLAKVRALPDLRLLPAHGPVAPSTHARVDQLAAHHDVRLGLCREAVRSDPLTAFSVAHELPWTRHEMHLDDLDLFNVALAVLETRAHLELLAARGEVTVSSSPEGLLYRCR